MQSPTPQWRYRTEFDCAAPPSSSLRHEAIARSSSQPQAVFNSTVRYLHSRTRLVHRRLFACRVGVQSKYQIWRQYKPFPVGRPRRALSCAHLVPGRCRPSIVWSPRRRRVAKIDKPPFRQWWRHMAMGCRRWPPIAGHSWHFFRINATDFSRLARSKVCLLFVVA